MSIDEGNQLKVRIIAALNPPTGNPNPEVST
jgi:hypothetical protein